MEFIYLGTYAKCYGLINRPTTVKGLNNQCCQQSIMSVVHRITVYTTVLHLVLNANTFKTDYIYCIHFVEACLLKSHSSLESATHVNACLMSPGPNEPQALFKEVQEFNRCYIYIYISAILIHRRQLFILGTNRKV